MSIPMLGCPGPVSRRNFLKLGGLALGGLGSHGILPWKLAAQERPDAESDTSVILIWLPGGPPHMETYDMKPDAPPEDRGAFRPIQTGRPALEVFGHPPL